MTRSPRDRRRLEPANYPLRFETRALYGDVDANRHVNNVAYARWFEEGRAQLNERVSGPGMLLDPPAGEQLLLVSIQIEYLAQVPYPATVVVAAAVSVLGGASYGIAHGLFHEGRCAALGDSVVVRARAGRPARLSPAERATLASLATFPP
jgi:acyl-CoA thioester hydrolase